MNQISALEAKGLFSELPLVQEVGLRLAKDAGVLIANYRKNKSVEVSHKSSVDLVTNADMEAEKLIIAGITENFPDHQILSEETHSELSCADDYLAPLWIIDPIDGTINYAHDLPVVAVSIAFAFQGRVLFGVVDAPFLGECYHATAGEGAYMNDTPIKVSEVADPNESLVAMGFPHARREISGMLSRQLELMLQNCQDVRRAGAAAIDLCWVAGGRLEFYFEDVNPWDIAAGGLIVREAGGRSSNYAPNEVHPFIPEDLNAYRFLASNRATHDQAKELLVSCR